VEWHSKPPPMMIDKESRNAGKESPSDSCLPAFLIHPLFTLLKGSWFARQRVKLGSTAYFDKRTFGHFQAP
jgi:hypothetical protein